MIKVSERSKEIHRKCWQRMGEILDSMAERDKVILAGKKDPDISSVITIKRPDFTISK